MTSSPTPLSRDIANQQFLFERVQEISDNQEDMIRKQDEMSRKQDEMMALLKFLKDAHVRSAEKSSKGKSRKNRKFKDRTGDKRAMSPLSRDPMLVIDPGVRDNIVQESVMWCTDTQDEMIMVKDARTLILTNIWIAQMFEVLPAEQFAVLDSMSTAEQELVYINIASQVRSITGYISSKRTINSSTKAVNMKRRAENQDGSRVRKFGEIAANKKRKPEKTASTRSEADLSEDDEGGKDNEERPAKRPRSSKSYKERTTLIIQNHDDSSDEDIDEDDEDAASDENVKRGSAGESDEDVEEDDEEEQVNVKMEEERPVKQLHSVHLYKDITTFLNQDSDGSSVEDTDEECEDIASGWVNSRAITVRNLKPVDETPNGETVIWDFVEKEWVKWEPDSDKDRARSLLKKWASKVLKITYFRTHTCTVEDLEECIPERLWSQVFTPASIKTFLSQEQKQFHSRVLTNNLTSIIIPRWKKRADWLVGNYVYKAGTKVEDDKVLQYLEGLARSDTFAQQRFFSQLQESVNWKGISEQSSQNDTECFEWGVRCLTMAAAIVCSLESNSEATKPSTSATTISRNKAWVRLAAMPNNTFSIELNQIRLENEFGAGKRTKMSKHRDLQLLERSDELTQDSNLALETRTKPATDANIQSEIGVGNTQDTVATEPKVSPIKRTGPRKRDADLTPEELASRKKRRKERVSVATLSGGNLFSGATKG
ncbi:hypothetical protein VTL71DRAFT_125 [Oculimacula yallundae]|uniref:Uncharacterized protein n=1 Tax=Oculimacula yallundae TaxID=86028 RepID=A0ABR4CZ38_9HELO